MISMDIKEVQILVDRSVAKRRLWRQVSKEDFAMTAVCQWSE